METRTEAACLILDVHRLERLSQLVPIGGCLLHWANSRVGGG